MCQNEEHTEIWVTIVSIIIALVTFVRVVLYHMFLRFQEIKSLCTVKFGRGCRGEELEWFSEDSEEVATNRPLQTTSSEVWLSREPLIYY